MKTTFPEHDDRRFFAMDIDSYARALARGASSPRVSGVEHVVPVIDEEEAAVEQLGIRIGTASLEILMGWRPVHHLSAWVSPGCFRAFEKQVAVVRKVVAERHRKFPPVRSQLRPQPLKPVRIIVQRVSSVAFEMSLLVSDGLMTRAVALRAEKVRKSWRITSLQVA
ncbi:Rv3235 family protein [Rothia nasimurium]|uniref:Rv3235 family protein n=1 Tax=Rothia nasimurium TaxID=85336 RepID=UPI001F43F7B4|nr:Rv3235 family protein [Rothia nasimurium]